MKSNSPIKRIEECHAKKHMDSFVCGINTRLDSSLALSNCFRVIKVYQNPTGTVSYAKSKYDIMRSSFIYHTCKCILIFLLGQLFAIFNQWLSTRAFGRRVDFH